MNLFAPVAVWGFWGLLALGWTLGELRVRGIAIFVALWLAAFLGSRLVLQGTLFLPLIAVIDIALVFVVFRGDVRLR
jgi:hypothetical protein